jgi:hypothetical protein
METKKMNYRVRVLLLALLVYWLQVLPVFSQVGINAMGNNPDPSAMLDVAADGATKGGVLIPRIALTGPTDATTIPNPATSLLVYNTNTAGGLTPGYYYNAGTSASPNWVRLLNGSSPSDVWLTLGNAGTNPSTHFVGTTDNEDLVFRMNNTEKMRITAGGNVGIGTTAPLGKLHVNNDVVGDDSFFVVKQSGNVGIGTTNPGSLLEIYGSGGDAKGIRLISTGTNTPMTYIFPGASTPDAGFITFGDGTGWKFHIAKRSDAGGTKFLTIQDNGNVGIGTANPGYKLHVIGSVFATGVVYCNSSALCSDERWKTNIKPIQNALHNVLKIQGVTYYWKVDEYPDMHFSEGEQIGFIAQEVEKIYPQVVLTDKDGYKSIDYSKLTPILVEAIKDQQKIIEKLQAENTQIKAENAQIKSEVKALAEQVNNLINILSAAKKVGNK